MSKATASTRRFLKIAVLTISDSRCFQTDSSGSWLQEAIENDGHELVDRKIVVDDIY
ncbi:MAG: molybdenum cofactor biosynthesis protein, partial [Porticoccaceae bacterium]|nr:molybdenum cofactor biosynthesis protein [Porticoccaceae bacterium]